MELSKAEKELLDATVLEDIRQAYAAWRSRGGKEPSLTVTVLVDYVDNHNPGTFWQAARKRTRSSWVRAALGRLERDGLLRRSHGLSPDSRTRVVCMWDPVA